MLQLPAPYKREKPPLQITYSDEAQLALSDCENAGSLLRAINFICQKTWGFKKQTDRISLTQFERALGWSRTRVTRAVDALERLQLVTVNRSGAINKFTPNEHYIKRGVERKVIEVNTTRGYREALLKQLAEQTTGEWLDVDDKWLDVDAVASSVGATHNYTVENYKDYLLLNYPSAGRSEGVGDLQVSKMRSAYAQHETLGALVEGSDTEWREILQGVPIHLLRMSYRYLLHATENRCIIPKRINPVVLFHMATGAFQLLRKREQCRAERALETQREVLAEADSVDTKQLEHITQQTVERFLERVQQLQTEQQETDRREQVIKQQQAKLREAAQADIERTARIGTPEATTPYEPMERGDDAHRKEFSWLLKNDGIAAASRYIITNCPHLTGELMGAKERE